MCFASVGLSPLKPLQGAFREPSKNPSKKRAIPWPPWCAPYSEGGKQTIHKKHIEEFGCRSASEVSWGRLGGRVPLTSGCPDLMSVQFHRDWTECPRDGRVTSMGQMGHVHKMVAIQKWTYPNKFLHDYWFFLFPFMRVRWKTVSFTEKCFIASPPPKLATTFFFEVFPPWSIVFPFQFEANPCDEASCGLVGLFFCFASISAVLGSWSLYSPFVLWDFGPFWLVSLPSATNEHGHEDHDPHNK